MTSSSLTSPCKYSCSAPKGLKANWGGKNQLQESDWYRLESKKPTTPMDVWLRHDSRRCWTGKSYGPLSSRAFSDASLWTPFYLQTHKMEALRKADLRDDSSVLWLLVRGSSQLSTAVLAFPPHSSIPTLPPPASLVWSPSTTCSEFHCCLHLGKIQIVISRTANISLRHFLPQKVCWHWGLQFSIQRIQKN